MHTRTTYTKIEVPFTQTNTKSSSFVTTVLDKDSYEEFDSNGLHRRSFTLGLITGGGFALLGVLIGVVLS